MKGAKIIKMEGEGKGKEEVVVIPVGKYIDDRINEGVDGLGNSINSQIALLRNDTKGLETSIGKDIESLKRYQTLMTAVYGLIVGVSIAIAGWFMYQAGENSKAYSNATKQEIMAYKENSDIQLKFIEAKIEETGKNAKFLDEKIMFYYHESLKKGEKK